jgi:hypothetical protein
MRERRSGRRRESGKVGKNPKNAARTAATSDGTTAQHACERASGRQAGKGRRTAAGLKPRQPPMPLQPPGSPAGIATGQPGQPQPPGSPAAARGMRGLPHSRRRARRTALKAAPACRPSTARRHHPAAQPRSASGCSPAANPAPLRLLLLFRLFSPLSPRPAFAVASQHRGTPPWRPWSPPPLQPASTCGLTAAAEPRRAPPAGPCNQPPPAVSPPPAAAEPRRTPPAAPSAKPRGGASNHHRRPPYSHHN